MKKFFVNLYEVFIGKSEETGLYRSDIFPSVGFYTVFITLLMMLIYYYVLNHIFSVGRNKLIQWVLILIINAVACAGIAWYYSIKQGATLETFRLYFTFTNLVFGAILFVFFSFLGKSKSRYAKAQPSLWPRW